MLASRLSLKYCATDQKMVLDQLINQSTVISFNESELNPGREELEDLFSLIDKIITESKQEEIFIEIQILLLLTIIQGIDFHQALKLQFENWQRIESIAHTKARLLIASKNQYCDKLIRSLNRMEGKKGVFQKLNQTNALQCLNLFLVMNGFEYVLTERKLELAFGRFHYLRHGRIRGVRELLKEYFDCDNHIELLVKLRLVDSVHYNTMVRN